jgi:D-serine deaminase-like pyridoxal phosphate-dependent protein
MAQYFAGHGWRDILIAFPVNGRALDEINDLASRIRLQLLVSDGAMIETLAKNLRFPVGVRVEVDTGQGRTGLPADDHAAIDGMVEKVDAHKRLTFRGIYSHPGHTYLETSVEGIRKVYRRVVDKMGALHHRYAADHPGTECTCGDTPGCSASEDFGGITEITPGNFVFYDLMQERTGACSVSDIAVAMACPVVLKDEKKSEVVIHGGAVHFSKDALTDASGTPFFGQVAEHLDPGWGELVGDTRLSKISQEHGVITTGNRAWLKSVSVGDIIVVLPVHACLTANLMRSYRTLDGKWISGPAGFMP